MHEMAHFIPAYLMGKVISFSLKPKVTEKGVVFGEVVYMPKTSFDMAVSSMAPLLYWFLLFWWIQRINLLNWYYSDGLLNLTLSFNALKGIKGIFETYCFLQLLWAGRVSSTDIAIFIKATWMWWAFILVFVLWIWEKGDILAHFIVPVLDVIRFMEGLWNRKIL